jgi:polysaccharide pyruvyl transferase WcaK-like protein
VNQKSIYRLIAIRNLCYRIKEEKFVRLYGRKLSHITYYAVGNAGDTMLSQCTRRMFHSLAKHWYIVKVTTPVSQKMIHKINKTAGLVIGGGGLFISDTNQNTIIGWQWAISEENLKEIKVPIIIYSIGYNYFRGQVTSELFQRSIEGLVAQAAFVGLRNSGSVNAIRNMLPYQLKEKVVFQPCITTLISKVYKFKHDTYQNRIAFNVAFDRLDKRLGENCDVILQQIAASARVIAQMGYQLIYVAHMKSDLQFIPYLHHMIQTFRVVDLSNALPPKILHFYRHVDIVAGMRGHAQMIPFGCNCGIITLGSHDKMKWFLEDIKALELYVELNDHGEDICNQIVSCFIQNYAGPQFTKTLDKLAQKQNELYETSRNNMKCIKNHM